MQASRVRSRPRPDATGAGSAQQHALGRPPRRTRDTATGTAAESESEHSGSDRSRDAGSFSVDLRTIQELLGHKDVKTTMVYTLVIGRGGGRGVISPADVVMPAAGSDSRK
jgi:integrase